MERPPAPTIPLRADEPTTLVAFLAFYRAALVDRVFDLDPAGFTATLPPSTLNLARLIGHMTLVEYNWFQDRFAGEGVPETYHGLDWDADPDAEMTRAESLTIDELLAEFHAAVADSEARVEAAQSLDQLSAEPNHEDERWNLRWIMVHMIEEYARHCGHADLIREAYDGNVAS